MSLEERSSYILNTMKHLDFRKENGLWFADVSEVSKWETEMVNDSDSFLDEISQGGDSVSLNVSDKIYPKARFVFQRMEFDEDGATYLILDHHHDAPGLSGESVVYSGRKIGLPPVFHRIFGEYPEFISVI